MDTTPQPTEIKLHQKSRRMEIVFSDGSQFELSYELLRVYSPSAEVRGHGPGQEVLQVGKRDVEILTLEPSGSYAVQPTFSDGHSTGIYSWDYLFWLGPNREKLWREYLQRLESGRGEPRAGARAFRAAAEIKIGNRPSAFAVDVAHAPLPAATAPFKVVLINPYELGRQPFALAEPAAWLKRDGLRGEPASIFRCRSSIPTS